MAHPQISDLTNKTVFTTGEAAGLCKISQQTIIRCFDSHRLNGFRVPGSRFRRIPRDELLRFMHENDIPTNELENHKQRILIVDDDELIVELFIDILSSYSCYEVKSASTGYDAGLMTEQFKPDLIILDYMLPDINGNMVCKRIRSNPQMDHIKIIIVSGVVDQSEVNQLLESGANDFIKKPFNIETLLKKINALTA